MNNRQWLRKHVRHRSQTSNPPGVIVLDITPPRWTAEQVKQLKEEFQKVSQRAKPLL